MRTLDFGVAGVPDRGMQAGGDAPPHQRVIGGMELDDVDPRAVRIEGLQDRRAGIGDAAELEGLGRAPDLAMGGELVDDRVGDALDQGRQRRVGIEQIDARRTAATG